MATFESIGYSGMQFVYHKSQYSMTLDAVKLHQVSMR